MTNPKKRLGVIAGPTASGKTALALKLAQRHAITIINADSAQVYAHLPILSAQPNPDEMAQAPHRLFGYLDGRTACSAAAWARDAKAEIDAAWSQGRMPLLVGGTGLYLRTLVDGIAPVPEIDPTIREKVRAMSTDAAEAALAREDAAARARLSATDGSRIKRALEVIRSTGKSILAWRETKNGGIGRDVDISALILLPPREWLHQRCDNRFSQMIDDGAVEEVEALLQLDLPHDAPVLRAIGVPEISAMMRGEIGQPECIARGQAATRQYAKRQYTWFRNQPPAHWIRHYEAYNDSQIVEIERILRLL